MAVPPVKVGKGTRKGDGGAPVKVGKEIRKEKVQWQCPCKRRKVG
jgi:hypothetical protein